MTETEVLFEDRDPRDTEPDYDPEEMLRYRARYLPVSAELGEWRLECHVLHMADDVWQHYAHKGIYIPPGEMYSYLFRGEGRGLENLWMSDTPPEIASMLPAIRRLQCRRDPVRRVLIGGLGMGIIAKIALDQPHVERVFVIEKDPDVTRLGRPHLRDPRLTVRKGDAVSWIPKGEWDYAYYDIWIHYSASNLADMLRIDELIARRVRERDHWGRERCERDMRRHVENGLIRRQEWKQYQKYKAVLDGAFERKRG